MLLVPIQVRPSVAEALNGLTHENVADVVRERLLEAPRLARARWLAQEILLCGADRGLIHAAAPDTRWLARFDQWAKQVHPTDQQLEKLPIEHDGDRKDPEVARVLADEKAGRKKGQAEFPAISIAKSARPKRAGSAKSTPPPPPESLSE